MQFLLNHCHIAFEQNGSIFLTLFLAGLFGGFTHCAGMCGPFVIAQTKCENGYETNMEKLSGAALLPYHFGRMTTYIFLGMTAAILAKQIIETPMQKGLSFTFLLVAGVVFIASALPQAKNFLSSFRRKGPSILGAFIGKIAAPLFKRPTSLKGYGLGLLLGFLPCGLVFASLMIVATTGSVFTAALGMLLFTIGTFPSMFLIGLAGRLVYKKWPNGMQGVARAVMIFNGLSLFALAGNIAL